MYENARRGSFFARTICDFLSGDIMRTTSRCQIYIISVLSGISILFPLNRNGARVFSVRLKRKKKKKTRRRHNVSSGAGHRHAYLLHARGEQLELSFAILQRSFPCYSNSLDLIAIGRYRPKIGLKFQPISPHKYRRTVQTTIFITHHNV